MKVLRANGICLAIQAGDPFFFDETGFLGFADADLVARWAAGSLHPMASSPAEEASVDAYPAPIYWDNIREEKDFVFADRAGKTYRFLKNDFQGRATADHRCYDADYYGPHPAPPAG